MAAEFINDHWVLDDSLGMGKAGDALASMALQVHSPFTVGVTGKWGSGKTSVMRRAFATLGGVPIKQELQFGGDKTELQDEDFKKLSHNQRKEQLSWPSELHELSEQCLCVWYSPWQHQDAVNPLVPLLQEIRAQYKIKRSPFENIKDKAKQLNRQGALAAWVLMEQLIDAAASLHMQRPVKLAGGLAENVKKAWDQDNPAGLLKPGDGQRFHLLFEDAVENLLTDLQACKTKNPNRYKVSPEARLILFIDDLDRCEEKTVVALLEAIKLYLGTQRCVFILGVDDVAVSESLKRHWQGRSDDNNREYLEKLFQASMPVPLPRPDKLQGLIETQLKAHGFPVHTVTALAEDIEALLEPNPRKVKNFLNTLCATWRVLQCSAMQTPENCRRLVMFQYLRLYHRPVWRILERQPKLLPLLQQELNSAPGQVGASPEQLGFLPPGIADDDLRMTRKIFSRAFAHVLKHDSDKDDEHCGLKLEVAAEALLERLDRRRSDEYFVSWVRNALSNNEALDPMFLRISDEA